MNSPLVSIFTPSHYTEYLDDAYNSIINQTYDNWEWIILLNNDASWTPPCEDERIVIKSSDGIEGVGALKRICCEYASGEYLLELDHDDILVSDCLEKVVKAFEENQDCGFVYSFTAQIDSKGDADETKFSAAMGWEYSDEIIDGKKLSVASSFEPYPSCVSYIWFAPNHVRAFRRAEYDIVGGYDSSLDVLDDQDLMSRLYKVTNFYRIPECLYLQRTHAKNTQKDEILNTRIQIETVNIYDKYIEDNVLAWSARNNLLSLDFGSAHNKPRGYLGVDKYPGEGIDIVAEIPDQLHYIADDSVGVIRAVDFFEHIEDKISLFNEMYRILAHGGMILSCTPSTDGRGAFQDPTHISFYNENSFWYFTNEFYSKYVPEIKCKFQVSRILTYYPNEWCEKNNISYVLANLIAIKNGPRLAGELLYS